MAKRVTLTLEVDSTFVSLLQANVQMKGLLREDRSHGLDPMGQLAVLVLAEARGATELQILEKVEPNWRPHITALHEKRSVVEVSE